MSAVFVIRAIPLAQRIAACRKHIWVQRHCEERERRSNHSSFAIAPWIASLTLAMTADARSP
jgi:hypothetical protein